MFSGCDEGTRRTRPLRSVAKLGFRAEFTGKFKQEGDRLDCTIDSLVVNLPKTCTDHAAQRTQQR